MVSIICRVDYTPDTVTQGDDTKEKLYHITHTYAHTHTHTQMGLRSSPKTAAWPAT